jgi:flagellar hook-length control protein FliK
VSAPAFAPGSAATAATTATATAHAAFAAQLGQPLLRLAATPRGERSITVRVAPEDLGPVTVKAVVGADGVRLELSAPNDAGRDALRQVLGDLRRDLAAAGFGASLDLGSGDAQDPRAERETSAHPEGKPGRDATRAPATSASPSPATQVPRTWQPTSTLDTVA